MAAIEFREAAKTDTTGRADGFAAYCMAAGGEQAGALTHADRAIGLGFRTAPVYANRAYSHSKSGLHEDAISDCNEAIRLDPNLLAARYTRAYTCLQLHHYQKAAIPPEAVIDIERVTAGMPDVPVDVWDTAAQLYALTSADNSTRRDRAGQAAKKAVLAGKSPTALGRNIVLQALKGQKDYEEALTMRPGPVAHSANPHLARPTP